MVARFVVIVCMAGGCGRLSFEPLGALDPTTPPTTGEWRTVSMAREGGCAITNTDELWCWGRRQPIARVTAGPARWATVATSGHACGIGDDGSLWCWGDNNYGQVGTGEAGNSYSDPQRIGSSSWREIALAVRSSCGIQVDGSLWCWGTAKAGELGQGLVMDQQTAPVRVGTANDWSGISASNDSLCALRGTDAWCWGENANGPLGDGTTVTQPAPVRVLGGQAFRQVVVGEDHGCGIDMAGTMWCWGAALTGEPSTGASPPAIRALSGTWARLPRSLAPRSSCAIDLDDRLTCWGVNDYGQLALARSVDVEATVTMGGASVATASLASTVGGFVTLDGELYTSGQNLMGVVGGVSPDSADLISVDSEVWSSITMGESHGCGLTQGGELKCWGATTWPLASAVPVSFGSGFTQVEAGMRFTLAIDASRQVWGWGYLPEANLEPTPIMLGLTADRVAAGDTHWCALDGTSLRCAGYNRSRQLGDGTSISTATPVTVPGTWQRVAVGWYHTCAIALDGTTWCWGANTQGQLGRGTTESNPCAPDDPDACAYDAVGLDPAPVQTGETFAEIAASIISTCARGTATYCWGDNTGARMLGDAAGGDQNLPVMMSTNTTNLALGDAHACGLRGDELWCWGHRNELADDFTAPTQIPGTWSQYAGGFHTGCALDTSGRRHCWGHNQSGQFGDGRSWSEVPVRMTRP